MSSSGRKAIIFSNNKKLCRLIEIELMLCSYTVSVQRSAEAWQSKRIADSYDCVILDTTDGQSALLPTVPRAPLSIAIIDNSSDEVWTSVDHVLEYPFVLDELRALLIYGDFAERSETALHADAQKCFYVDSSSRDKNIIFNDTVISLSDYELRVLTMLCENAGKCVSREEISSALGAEDGNIAEVYICHLRRKLEAPFGIKVIHTVRSKGYYTEYVMVG